MRYVMLLVIGLTLLTLMGCGGSGPAEGPPAPQVGGLSGQLSAANAEDYQIILDGQPLQTRPNADGSFNIPNLPPGTYTVSFVSGMVGAHMIVEVLPGETTDVGEVVPVVGGQIVGFVMRMDDEGNLTPLPGVEVLADPEPIYVIDDPMPAAIAPRDAGQIQYRAMTNADGSYLIPAVPEGGYVVTVSVPGLVQGVAYVWVSPGMTSPADFHLQEAVDPGVATVKGQVLAALGAGPAPLKGARVTIISDGEWRPTPTPGPIPLPAEVLGKALMPADATGVMMPPYYFDQFTTLTDGNGEYSLNVPTGHLQLTAWGEGYEAAFDSFTARPDEVLVRNYTLMLVGLPPPVEPQSKSK